MSEKKVYFNDILLDYERDIIGGNILKIIAEHKDSDDIEQLRSLILSITALCRNYHRSEIDKYGSDNAGYVIEHRYVNWIEICVQLLDIKELTEKYVEHVLIFLKSRFLYHKEYFDTRLTEECYQSLDKLNKIMTDFLKKIPRNRYFCLKDYYISILHNFFLEEDNDKKRLYDILIFDDDSLIKNKNDYYTCFIKFIGDIIYNDNPSLEDVLFNKLFIIHYSTHGIYLDYNRHIKTICDLVKMPEALKSKYIFTKRLGEYIEKIVKYYDSREKKIERRKFIFETRRRLTVMDDILHIRNVLEKNNIYIFSEPFESDTFSFYLKHYSNDIDVFEYMQKRNPNFHLNQNKKESYLYTVANIIKQKHLKDGSFIRHYDSHHTREGDWYSSEDEYYYFEEDHDYTKCVNFLEYMCLNGAKFLVGEMKKLGKKNSVAKLIRKMRKQRKIVLQERYEELDNYFKELDTNNTYDTNISYYISKMLPIEITVDI